MVFHIGVDIGLDGAFSVIDEKQRVRYTFPMPVVKGKRTNYDIQKIVTIFRTLKKEEGEIYVVVEKPIPRPTIGCTANFMLGGGLFLFEGILSSLQISYEVITARTWQKELLKGLPKDTKTASILFCKRKWPDVNLTKTERSRKDHDGIADSLCMADYCFRLNRK